MLARTDAGGGLATRTPRLVQCIAEAPDRIVRDINDEPAPRYDSNVRPQALASRLLTFHVFLGSYGSVALQRIQMSAVDGQ